MSEPVTDLAPEIAQLAVPEPTVTDQPLLGALDAAGEQFDREVHTGTKRKDGTWRRRKRTPSAEQSQEDIVEQKRKTFAAISVDTVTAALQAGFGAHWKPDPSERDNLVSATDAVLADYDIDDLPPWVGLVLASALYAVPRIEWEKLQAYFAEKS